MNRLIGILLIILGILCLVVGFITLIVLDDPKNTQLGVTVFAIMLGIGVISIVLGVWMLKKTKTTTIARAGNYLADLPEKRLHDGIVFEVQYQTPIKGKNGR